MTEADLYLLFSVLANEVWAHLQQLKITHTSLILSNWLDSHPEILSSFFNPLLHEETDQRSGKIKLQSWRPVAKNSQFLVPRCCYPGSPISSLPHADISHSCPRELCACSSKVWWGLESASENISMNVAPSIFGATVVRHIAHIGL